MTRETFHAFLQDLIRSKNVYYQPPADLKMKYPCVRYQPANIDIKEADNHGYITTRAYDVLYISKTQDENVALQLARFPRSRHDRSYKQSGLYHESFTIYI